MHTYSEVGHLTLIENGSNMIPGDRLDVLLKSFAQVPEKALAEAPKLFLNHRTQEF